jgi:hypothetical protein
MLRDVCDDIHDDDRKFNEITRLMADLERSRELALVVAAVPLRGR